MWPPFRAELVRAILATEWVNRALGRHHHRGLTLLLQAASSLVSEMFFLVGIPTITFGADPTLGLSSIYLLCLVLYVSNLVKNIYRAPRPNGVDTTKWMTERGYGFPSSHSSSAAALPLFFLMRWPDDSTRATASGVAPLLTAAIAVSRLYLGVHSVPDVVGGLAIGTALVLNVGPLLAFQASAIVAAPALTAVSGLAAAIALVWLHPNPNPMNSTLDESAVVLGAWAGGVLGECTFSGVRGVPASFGARAARVVVGLLVQAAVKVLTKKILLRAVRPFGPTIGRALAGPGASSSDTGSGGNSDKGSAVKSAAARARWGRVKTEFTAMHAFNPFAIEHAHEDEAERATLLAVRLFNYAFTAWAAADGAWRVFEALGL